MEQTTNYYFFVVGLDDWHQFMAVYKTLYIHLSFEENVFIYMISWLKTNVQL